jgi:hypothetical protein
MQTQVLQPLVASWLGKIQEAQRTKKAFDDTAKQCMEFFSGSCGFMWQSEYMAKYIGGQISPRFRITIAKAFELVALFGPTLYWRNPHRVVKPRERLTLDPALFGGLDPTGWIFYQSQQQSQIEAVNDKAAAALLEMYLNYTPLEQPDGGLATHASDAITEALIKGGGCIWPRPYFMPGSQRLLTGCFYDSIDNLLIDPDATSLADAKWIAQLCCHPTWEVERTFGLPEGSLDGRGQYESADAQGRNLLNPWAGSERRIGKSHDLMTYWKIWSKGGCGGRLAGPARMDDGLSRQMDQVLGDYAYIVVAPNVPWPLNCPLEFLVGASDSEIFQRFQWPVPYWRDNRWPVSVLSFYKRPGTPWPIAPLAPGLGELTYLNILLSSIANHIWMSSRSFPAIPRGIDKELEATILSGQDLAPLRYTQSNGLKAEDIVKFIQHPPMNPDVWKIFDAIMQMFDRRVGLTELLYGLNPGGAVSRSAEDIATKKEMVSIRPDYMAGKVEDWMTHVAEMERQCALKYIDPQHGDLAGLFAPIEQQLWTRLLTGQPEEFLYRDLRATIAANSTRKPDKARDTENMQQMLQPLLQLMEQHMQMTGDVSAVNGLLMKWGKVIDQDMSDVILPPIQQSGNQEADAAYQQQQMELQAHQQQLMIGQQQHGMTLAMNHQKATHAHEMHRAKLDQMKQQMSLKRQQARQKPRPKARAA